MKILNRIFPEVKTEFKMDMKLKNLQQEKSEPVTSYSVEDQKIKELFDKHGIEMSKENLEDVKVFLKETDGDLVSKLATVDAALEKGVEPTVKHLRQIHYALNNEIDISTEPLTLDSLKSLLAKVSLDNTADGKALSNDVMPIEDKIKLFIQEKLTTIFIETDDIEKPIIESKSNTIETAKPMTQSKEIPYKESQVLEHTESETSFDDASKTSVDDKSEEVFMEALSEVFEELSESIDEVAELLAPVVNSELFTEPLPTKKFLQTEVTVKMIEMKKTFEMYQQAIDSQLSKGLEKPESKIQLKEILSAAIDKLDHVLMKTDVTLYTDLKTERNLLASSGLLEKARHLIDNNIDEAIKIIKDVKKELSQIKFEPSRQKMFGVTQKLLVQNLYEQELIRDIPIQMEQNMQMSPRAVLETLRGLGINHDAEVSEILNKDQKSAFKVPHNMKSILMKLDETHQQKVVGKENFDQLTGQQLLNKLEIKSHKQKLMFQVPVTIDGDVKNLKVHVNAKKENQKIDWKNSRLYFVIHLDKLGDTGVVVDVQNGSTQITVKNDTENVAVMMKPYVDEAMIRLEEVGFTAASIKFESLNKQEVQVTHTELKKEGFDVII